MIISILKEIRRQENRVAATPETVKQLKYSGFTVKVEKGAGENAGFSDKEYDEAGARLVSTAKEGYKADIILKIWAPEKSEEKLLQPDTTVIANFQALAQPEKISRFAELGLTCFALDLIPRISRAQNMDILSSQSNLAGYKAVINAVAMFGKAVPMMMTSAGTIPPAKILVLGAGVAGLQAIATAKRLGAQVFAFDVRPQVKEQVESLGGKFIEIDTAENFENAKGYAKDTSEDYKRKQSLAIEEQLDKTDIAVTTALVPGQKAPVLISSQMLKKMPAGSIVMDLAAANGGNAEGSKEGKTVEINGVKIVGASNLASEIPYSASNLYARNILNFLMASYDAEEQKIVFNFEDEIIKATCVCRAGKVLTGEK